ncbi:MAG: hypothetical protein ACR2RV_06365 [Verrucomicrobiales bacterium]
MESGKDAAAEQLIFDHRAADLPVEDHALCEFAVKLTLAPGAMVENDVVALRDHGFSDTAITIATQVIGYFNYINRIADGLSVDAEDWMTLDPDEWRRRKVDARAADDH